VGLKAIRGVWHYRSYKFFLWVIKGEGKSPKRRSQEHERYQGEKGRKNAKEMGESKKKTWCHSISWAMTIRAVNLCHIPFSLRADSQKIAKEW